MRDAQGEALTTEFKLPYQLDTQALAVCIYAVLDINYKAVCECETYEEAVAFVAKANGSDVETVRKDAVKHGEMLQEYLENVRRARRESQQDK